MRKFLDKLEPNFKKGGKWEGWYALYEAIDKGLLGDLVELEVHVNVHTPWELWPFLKTLDRVEIPLHSIHYIDWIRSVLGNPAGVYCQSVKHPKVTELADCRSSAIFNYTPRVRWCG